MTAPDADLMHVFSKLPRDLNFIDHTSNISWKAYVLCSHPIAGPVHAFSIDLFLAIEMSPPCCQVREGDAGDHRPGAVHEDEGRPVLGAGEAELADGLQALHWYGHPSPCSNHP